MTYLFHEHDSLASLRHEALRLVDHDLVPQLVLDDSVAVGILIAGARPGQLAVAEQEGRHLDEGEVGLRQHALLDQVVVGDAVDHVAGTGDQPEIVLPVALHQRGRRQAGTVVGVGAAVDDPEKAVGAAAMRFVGDEELHARQKVLHLGALVAHADQLGDLLEAILEDRHLGRLLHHLDIGLVAMQLLGELGRVRLFAGLQDRLDFLDVTPKTPGQVGGARRPSLVHGVARGDLLGVPEDAALDLPVLEILAMRLPVDFPVAHDRLHRRHRDL